MDKVEYHPTTVIIVLSVIDEEGNNHMVGAVVDAVSDVLDIEDSEIKTAPSIATRINDRYIRGMVTRGERMVVLLDVDLLFKANDLGILDSLGQ